MVESTSSQKQPCFSQSPPAPGLGTKTGTKHKATWLSLPRGSPPLPPTALSSKEGAPKVGLLTGKEPSTLLNLGLIKFTCREAEGHKHTEALRQGGPTLPWF